MKALLLALLVLGSSAHAVNVSAPVLRGSGGVPLLPMAFAQSLHPGFPQSPASLSLSASLLSDSPLQGFRDAMARQNALPGGMAPADSALGLQVAAARFIADYNHVAKSASTAQMRRWLAEPAQEERLAVLSAYRGQLAQDDDGGLISAIDVAAHYYAFEDTALMRRMESIAAELRGERRDPQTLDGEALASQEGPSRLHASGLSRPDLSAVHAAPNTAPPSPAAAPDADAAEKKAVRVALKRIGAVIAVGIATAVALAMNPTGLHLGPIAFTGGPDAASAFLTIFGLALVLNFDNLAVIDTILQRVPAKHRETVKNAAFAAMLASRAVIFGLASVFLHAAPALLLVAGLWLMKSSWGGFKEALKGHDEEEQRDAAADAAAADAAERAWRERRNGVWAYIAAAAAFTAAVYLLPVGSSLLADFGLGADEVAAAFIITKDVGMIILAQLLGVVAIRELYTVLQWLKRRLPWIGKWGIPAVMLFLGLQIMLTIPGLVATGAAWLASTAPALAALAAQLPLLALGPAAAGALLLLAGAGALAKPASALARRSKGAALAGFLLAAVSLPLLLPHAWLHPLLMLSENPWFSAAVVLGILGSVGGANLLFHKPKPKPSGGAHA